MDQKEEHTNTFNKLEAASEDHLTDDQGKAGSDEDVKQALGQVAAARGVSEAELIREALRTLTSKAPPPRPRLPPHRAAPRRSQ